MHFLVGRACASSRAGYRIALAVTVDCPTARPVSGFSRLWLSKPLSDPRLKARGSLTNLRKCLILLMPGAGLEPARTFRSRGF